MHLKSANEKESIPSQVKNKESIVDQVNSVAKSFASIISVSVLG